MKIRVLAVAALLIDVAFPAFGQQISASDEEMMASRTSPTDGSFRLLPQRLMKPL